MNTKLFFAIILSAALIPNAQAQRPRPEGPPPAEGPRRGDWTKGIDANRNGTIEADEFQAAIERTFAEIDHNGDGTLDRNETPHPPPPMGDRIGPPPVRPGEGIMPMVPDQRPGSPAMAPGERPGPPPMGDNDLLPPFFFMDKFRTVETMTKAEFDRSAKEVFASMDANHDGVLTREESRPPKGDEGLMAPPPPPPPNAMFIAAELRFGDKLVKDQPFSAETVIEDTRLLFDGTLVKKEIRGSIYRDGTGRTRREMPLAMVGGVSIVGSDNKPQQLIFINDFALKLQYFLDPNARIARKSRIHDNPPPPPETDGPADAKTVSDGTKMIEGISCVGTRTEFEIPVGQFGNEKPLKVVSERWFSPELQVVVMSLHQDPMNGIHVFRLVNIKRSEPAADLFTVPAGFRVEGPSDRAPEAR